MKISKLFHWLYASLMLLPFASVVSTTLYYSFNKNAVIPQVEEVLSKEVDFNQKFDVDNFDEKSISTSNYGTISSTNGYISVNLLPKNSYNITLLSTPVITSNEGHIYYLKSTFPSDNDNSFFFANFSLGSPYLALGRHEATYSASYEFRYYRSTPYESSTILNGYVQYFDFTQMFGAGNEPTIEEFDTWFTDNYYNYILSEHIVIPNYDTIEVADSSINHFWLPSFGAIGYNIQSYIGWLIGDIFGLNVVDGIGFVIVRLFTYWLIISICWLIFDLLMYVPNLVHKWLDKAAID